MRLFPLLTALFFASPLAAQNACAPDDVQQINSCSGGNRVSIAIVGDVLLHRALQWRGYARGFDTIWGAAIPLLRSADLTIANLEGPTAAGFARNGRHVGDPGPVLDDTVYSGYPQFNYHPMIIDALRDAGVDIVTTANNHSMDRGPAGLDATLSALTSRRMDHVGAVMPGQPRISPLRIRTRIGRLSLIACTYGTNGLADPHRQVPLCYQNRADLLALVRAEAETGAGVIVLPHWGQEYQLSADGQQRRLARELVQAGAMAVVGTHPHVPQPWAMMDGPFGTVPIIYSTGNFVAAQTALPRATSIMAWLELCSGTQAPVVAGLGYIPLQMEFQGADPSLTLPRAGMGGRAQAGLSLLARLIPGYDLSTQTQCRQRRPARAQDLNVER